MTAKREVIADGRHLRLVREAGWEFAERRVVSGVVAIVAVTADRRLVLTDQRRIPVGKRVIDLPAGLVGDDPGAAGESAVVAGKRELLEETGFSAGTARLLGTHPTSPGMSSETVTFVHAGSLSRTGPGGGVEGEDIVVHTPLIAGLAAWLREREAQGDLVDVKVLAGIAYLRELGDG
jgi:ADP-ribose pyrophosphatase